MTTKNTTALHKLPSERSFGILFILFFGGLSTYASYKNWQNIFVVAFFSISLLLLPITFLLPKVLTPFNKAWYWLGQIMGKLVSPIVLGVIFYLLLTPVALIGRMVGRDELKLKKRQVDSYWIERKPVGPTSDSFKNQF
jgi:hypothetical protein